MVNLATEETEQPSPARRQFGPDAERQIGTIPWWGIVILIVIIVTLIALFVYVIVIRENDVRDDRRTIREGEYVLVWGDDFTTGTKSGLEVDRERVPARLSSRSTWRRRFRYDSGVNPDISSQLPIDLHRSIPDINYPDLERWTLQQAVEPGLTYFSDNVQNAFIHKGLLHQRLLKSRTVIVRDNRRYEYDLSSTRMISRLSTIGGFFNFRLKLPSQPGVKVKISLLPFLNVSMNQVGSDYGRWAACGEITILEYNTNDGIWRGYITYGGEPPNQIYAPKRDEIQPLDPSQWQIVGLQWTDQCINWIYNGSVNRGCVKGEIVQSIDCSRWFTWQLDANECDCRDADRRDWGSSSDRPIPDDPGSQSFRKLPAPAPFDRPFYLVIELTADLNSGTSLNEAQFDSSHEDEPVAEMLMDWVKLYHQPQSEGLLPIDTAPANERSSFDLADVLIADI